MLNKKSWLIFVFLLHTPNAVMANSLINTSSYQGITSDLRSFRIGEPIVILVVESTSAQSSAGTELSRGVDFSANISDSIANNSVGLGLSSDNDGSGKTIRKGSATTSLSAVISNVLPNNMIEITGEQNLMVNNENQKVTITGIARYVDISKDNTLSSKRIANAKVEIQGNGDINTTQEMGLVATVLRWLGL